MSLTLRGSSTVLDLRTSAASLRLGHNTGTATLGLVIATVAGPAGPAGPTGVITQAQVTTALAGQDVITGADSRALKPLSAESGYSWALTDSAGRASLLVKLDGTVVVPKVALSSAAVAMSNLTTDVVAGLAQPLPAESGYVWGVVDSAGRIALGVTTDGTVVLPKTNLPSYSMRAAENPNYLGHPFKDTAGRYQIKVRRKSDGKVMLTTANAFNTVEPVLTEDDKLLVRNDSTGTMSGYWLPAVGGSLWPMIPANAIDQFGDSLTENGVTSMSAAMATALGVPVVNYGMGSQSSDQIAARFGAIPTTVTLSGNSIPATTTAVSVTATSPTLLNAAGAGTRSILGSILGIPGTLSQAGQSGAVSFTRTTAGSVTSVPAGSLFVPSYQPTNCLTIWTGRNDNVNITANYNNTKARIAAMVATIKPYIKNYFVLGTLTATNEYTGNALHDAIVALNAELATTYAGNYLDPRRYLIDNGLAAAGITPTTQDTADIAGDTVPTSLHNVSDPIHINTAAYTALVNNLLVPAFQAKGWFS